MKNFCLLRIRLWFLFLLCVENNSKISTVSKCCRLNYNNRKYVKLLIFDSWTKKLKKFEISQNVYTTFKILWLIYFLVIREQSKSVSILFLQYKYRDLCCLSTVWKIYGCSLECSQDGYLSGGVRFPNNETETHVVVVGEDWYYLIALLTTLTPPKNTIYFFKSWKSKIKTHLLIFKSTKSAKATYYFRTRSVGVIRLPVSLEKGKQ